MTNVRSQRGDGAPITVTARRRPSDFDALSTGAALYSGTCSCCCCLHWVGAVVGAAVGYSKGDFSNRRPIVRKGSHVAFAAGIILAIVATVLAIEAFNGPITTYWGMPLLFLPVLFFVPAAVLVVASTLLTRRVDLPYRQVFKDREEIPQAQEGQSKGAYREAGAEEQVFVDKEILRLRDRDEFGFLLSLAARVIGYSLLGTFAGYVILVVLLFVCSI